MSDTPKTEDSMVAALLRERAGYAGRKGMDERVAAVDEQLRLRGYSPDGELVDQDDDSTTEGDDESAQRSTPPRGRRARAADKA
ncbi:hypothetical protein [Streptomyces sp. NPDC088794]|uniref:hypothetical protein n=1 Tax=Streptomyces sp. NPDC088794 TaxID=3365902 RepID=UPI0037FB4C3D